MELASVRALKALLTQTVLAPLTEPGRGPTHPAGPGGTLALGIASPRPNDFRLAVRYQRPELAHGREIDLIRQQARGDVDVRYIGRVAKRSEAPWSRQRHRPLCLGTSIGRLHTTPGTLGAVVRRRTDGARLLLSNNHVLAAEDRGEVGDAIFQPEPCAESNPDDVVALLAGVIKLKTVGANTVDVAVAALRDGIEVDARTLRGLGHLTGLGPDFLDEGTPVAKLGRTTGLTRGRVTAFEMDNLVVEFDIGFLRFDNQIEIEGTESGAFCDDGDSGALIVGEDLRAVGLLFAAGDTGGANGKGLTYANPIRSVLDALGVDLLT